MHFSTRYGVQYVVLGKRDVIWCKIFISLLPKNSICFANLWLNPQMPSFQLPLGHEDSQEHQQRFVTGVQLICRRKQALTLWNFCLFVVLLKPPSFLLEEQGC